MCVQSVPMMGNAPPSKKQADREFWYDVAGWGLLVGLTVGIIVLSRSAAQAGPPGK